MINTKLTALLIQRFSTLKFDMPQGKFFADKSYGFDTMFFCCRFISRFREGNKFFSKKLEPTSNKYIQDIFCIPKGGTGIPNYMREAINLLCFCGAMKKTEDGIYQIVDEDILDIYSSCVEHSYIVQYILAYCIFNNEGVWDVYKKMVLETSITRKGNIYKNEIVPLISAKNPGINEWRLFFSKYPTIILNYANQSNYVARTGNTRNRIVTISDIALNVLGTRSQIEEKKNSYLKDFSFPYISKVLEGYLINKPSHLSDIVLSDDLAASIADAKMDMLDPSGCTDHAKKHAQNNLYRVTTSKVRTVQDVFRDDLKNAVPNRCPVCGFDYGELLTASHIRPYSECTETVDAMNPDNGLLMCPMCDQLFEARGKLYMTIKESDGQIIYLDSISNVKWFDYIHGKQISSDYLTEGRKKYLKWHNKEFQKKHSGEIVHGKHDIPGIVSETDDIM